MMPNLLTREAIIADLNFVKKQKDNQKQTKWGTSVLLWEQRVSELEKQLAELSSVATSSASVAVVFDGLPVIGQNDIRLDFTTDALSMYQKMVTAAFASQGEDELNKRGKVRDVQRSKLYIRDIVRGSMGFILEELEPPQTDMFSTPLKNAVEEVTLLLSNLKTSSAEGFNEIIDRTEPRFVGAIQKFSKILKEAGASAKILGDENSVHFSVSEVNSLWDKFSEVSVQEVISNYAGVLLGILPESHRFELQVENNDIVSGEVSEELTLKYTLDVEFKDRLLLKPVIAYIKKTQTYRSGRMLREKTILENLEPNLVNIDGI